MERVARVLSRGPVVAALFVLLAVNAVLFTPAQRWVVPSADGIAGMPTVTHLQLSWTPERFAATLAEWSGEACAPAPGGDAPCVWPVDAAGVLDPPPVADGPDGLKRSIVALDLTFPLLYALFAIGLSIRLWDLLGARRRWLALVAGAAVTAGVCDLVENSLHLWLLRGVGTWEQAASASYPGAAVAAASVMATIKYAILAVLLASALVWAVLWAAGRLGRGSRP